MVKVNTQYGPYPYDLDDLVKKVKYKDKWVFYLEDVLRDGDRHSDKAGGLTLSILITCPDAYHHEYNRSVIHYFPVPAATFNRDSWARWLFDQVLLVEQHEASEFFDIDGEHIFAPMHGPGDNPYVIVHYVDEVKRRISFRGEVKES